MIEKFKVLCRLKRLREERLSRELQAKRAELSAAQDEIRQQTHIVEESRRTLPSRENAIYDAIMQRVVDVDEIDTTKAKLVLLQQDHQKLVDALERAIDIGTRLKGELEEIRAAYQTAQLNRDKFDTVKADLEQEGIQIAEYNEEIEIEDLFSRGRPMPS